MRGGAVGRQVAPRRGEGVVRRDPIEGFSSPSSALRPLQQQQQPLPRSYVVARPSEWVDSDVHSWSARMSETMSSEMPGLVAEAASALCRFNPEAIKRFAGPASYAVVDKVASRSRMSDRDLCGANPAGLLQLLWEACAVTNDREAMAATLADVGSTCLQGDTHRIFAHLLAIRRSQ